MKRVVLAACAAAALTGASTQFAVAADMPVKAVRPVVVPFTWTGWYVGGNVGGAWANSDVSTQLLGAVGVPIDIAAVSAASSPRMRESGFIGGVQGGYNHQFGSNWFAGWEADVSYMGIKARNAVTTPFPSTLPGGIIGPPTLFFTPSTEVSSDWLITARARTGLTVNNWLLYVTGGLAVGQLKYSQAIALLPPFVIRAGENITQFGWVVGAGFEYALNRNWTVKAEYLHVDLGDTDTLRGVCVPVCASFTTTSADLTIDIGRVGFNYRF